MFRASLVAQCEELTCQSRRLGFDPWSGRIPYALKQLSPGTTLLSLWSRAWELQRLKPKHPRTCALQKEKPLQREAQAPQLEKSARSNKDPEPKINK